jgi:formylglycine-generating enzyme required for sulfatase activity
MTHHRLETPDAVVPGAKHEGWQKDKGSRVLCKKPASLCHSGISTGILFSTLAVSAILVQLPPRRDRSDSTSKAIVLNSIGMKLTKVPAGNFMMGSPETEKQRATDEGPQHEVVISRPFLMGVYEVTQREYKRVIGSNPSHFSPTGFASNEVAGVNTDDFPLERVSWNEAQAFCKRLSGLPEEKKAKRIYTLPTEAQWEHACRAGTGTPTHFGSHLSWKEARIDGDQPYGSNEKKPRILQPVAVGSYEPNRFGLYDMHGNVLEWCADYYG